MSKISCFNYKILFATFICLCVTLACSRPVAVHEGHWENELSQPILPGIPHATYHSYGKYGFFVVETDLNLGKSVIESKDFVLISENGKTFPAIGIRLETGDYMIGDFSGTGGKMKSAALVFSVPEEEKKHTFKLKFRDRSPIRVPMRKQA